MKTAVSIPDPLFEQADDLASRLRKSRSQLYAEALRDYVARHDVDAVTEKLDTVCRDLEQENASTRFSSAAAQAVLRRVEW